MNEFAHYLSPVHIDHTLFADLGNPKSRMLDIPIHTPRTPVKSPKGYHIALLGIPEDRNATLKGAAEAPDRIRQKLYALHKPFHDIKVIDLGNLVNGKNVNDTYAALTDITQYLIENNVIPLYIGGSHDLSFGTYMAYPRLKKNINVVSIDSKFDIGNNEELFNSDSFLGRIILYEGANLFNLTNLAFQTYFVAQEDLNLMNRLFFDSIRLGAVRTDIAETEPILRDADMVSFDISAIKQSDAPGQHAPSPNGLTGEEACQLANYAGLSDRLTSFGIYNIIPQLDNASQTSHLAAHIIWYFIEGFYRRMGDYPVATLNDYKKFIVTLSSSGHEIIFYKSPKSERWWLEVPYPGNTKKKLMVACSYADYLTACNDEIPDRWWRAFQKVN